MRKAETQIEYHNGAFRFLENQREKDSKDFSDILKVEAYKYDMLTYDDIAVRIDFLDGTAVELFENSEEFKKAMKDMEQSLEGFDKDWFSKVAYPAFATNLTTLWERKN